jgi:glucose-1-phosphate thymidylyltransferase
VVVLGDNLIERDIRRGVANFYSQPRGARVFLKEVPDPERFGVPVFEGERIVRIEEKPKVPPSRFAVIGVYVYDARVFDIIGTLKPSGRGELEITDVNNQYLAWGELDYGYVEGWWTDAGSIESLYRATRLVAEERSEGR